MKKHDEQEMRKLYAHWLESGKSKAAFAAEQQIVAATFYYWIKKFQRQDLLSPTVATAGGFRLLPVGNPSGIAPREVLLRINYPSGITIELYEAVDPGFLRTLTAQLMLALSHSCRYFLYRTPADMRFGIHSLAGLVQNKLGFNPMSGDVFVFLSKRVNQIRLLQWDRDGFALYVKKLEQGTFEWPPGKDILISSHELTLLLQGVRLDSVRLRKRYTPLKTA